MSKYAPLGEYLRQHPYREIRCSFRDIEHVLGFKLPPSARKHPAWWSNNSSNNVMTEAWMNAGFRTRAVDIESERLTFERVEARPPDPEPTAPSPRPPDDLKLIQRVLEVLRGDDEDHAQKLRRAIIAALATPKIESALDIFASDLPEDAFEEVFPDRGENGWREIDL
ncbi:hypothetical protein [Methylocystis sp.]|uniref:DUF7662 domain-containing protein n=1 Tax=Methylocystis sp. TaxID=1911079 RepID=UPI002735AA08|nr:hypothetical protein [Methylocystis sp.]MDP3554156.1 hypothetical protein [Methylocystis sp.]